MTITNPPWLKAFSCAAVGALCAQATQVSSATVTAAAKLQTLKRNGAPSRSTHGPGRHPGRWLLRLSFVRSFARRGVSSLPGEQRRDNALEALGGPGRRLLLPAV